MVVVVLEGARTRSEELNDKIASPDALDSRKHTDAFVQEVITRFCRISWKVLAPHTASSA